jgi:hypothetical protein
MSTMSLYEWLVNGSSLHTSGFIFDAGRVERAKKIAVKHVATTPHPARWGINASINGYNVSLEVTGLLNSTVTVTASCTCADWLQSGGWTENRLCKHLLALAMSKHLPDEIAAKLPRAKAPVVSEENATPEAQSPAPSAPALPTFHERVMQTVDKAIEKLADKVREVLDAGYVPLMIGPTGCGKTSAIRRVAVEGGCRLVEHAGADSWSDSDLVGVIMPGGKAMPGPVAQALGHAREMGEPVLLFLDEFTRYNPRAQESLMRLLLPISAEVAVALGIGHDGEVRATSAPFWGDEWAPAELTRIALACNPWGTALDPALVRRTVPVTVSFDAKVAELFDGTLRAAIELSWKGAADGTLPLPLEYGELTRAQSAKDPAALDRYLTRLRAIDAAAADGFQALLK